MRVVINATSTIGNKTGIGRYTDELIRCLTQQMDEDELTSYPAAWVRRLRAPGKPAAPEPRNQPGACSRWRKLTPRGIAVGIAKRIRHYSIGPFRRLRTYARHTLSWSYDKAVLRRGRFDLYHEPNFFPIRCNLPTVSTFHDMSVLRFPQWHPPARIAWYEKNLESARRQISHYLTVSEHARGEIMTLLGIPAERITCIWNGVRPDMRPMDRSDYLPVLSKLNLSPGYLLHVGTLEPRKNLLRLMTAYTDLPPALREKHPLVLVGQWGWQFEEIAEYYETVGKHKGVRQVGFVADEDLPAIYNGARALVFPTHYEGFGIPAAEMMGCGGAVLASTAGALAEVVGRADLIEPENVEGWRESMLRVLVDDDWWRGLRRGVIERARRFTWDGCARETLRIYRQLTGQTAGASKKAA